ncbi:M23 family metallopeptidase [Segetibacter aerophilus]|uniref:Peptidase M23 n=1 Tax=Segetibacter aerophilus TaxID=670293 RepID=A0A512BIZ8_9BACT|nr:M23 family metallopeptidase [Segetibacter aerophilus]GEO11949.1 peptidase M23 [Segetibacter aerophilus]
MKQLAIFLLLFAYSLISKVSKAPVTKPEKQAKAITEYPKGYFRNPLDIPIKLAANFGELRPNHFHMGLDIRTNQRENLPVYAAAEGYVSRIKIEQFGFGRAIYITHPNGYTTLYAHLNEFYTPLNNYLKEKQYSDQQWEQEVEFEPSQFPVTKGQFIAFSGNTGGSAGPHLHFEIRDTKTGNNLNPWLFDLGLTDNIKPTIFRLYLYDRRYSTYQTSPVSIPISGINGNYSSASGVVTLRSPEVSFGISAGDKIHPVSNYYGIYEADISVNNTLKSAFKLNDFSYTDTRYINASIDYKTRLSGGSFIQHLSRLPGNYSLIFSQDGDGKILLTDTLVHGAEIVVKDVAGNTSVLKFKFRWDRSATNELTLAGQSVSMTPERENTFKTDDIEAVFSSRAFYDTVPFVYKSAPATDSKVVSQIHYLHNHTVPVHDSFTVRIKPSASLAKEDKEKVVMQLVSNRKTEVVKGTWVNDWMEAKFRDLGIVRLLVDNVAPRITATGFVNGGSVRNKKSISLLVTDNLGELKSFKALLDGSWLLFSRKNDSFIHTFDERTSPGRHELVVTAEDLAGNVSEKTFTFNR